MQFSSCFSWIFHVETFLWESDAVTRKPKRCVCDCAAPISLAKGCRSLCCHSIGNSQNNFGCSSCITSTSVEQSVEGTNAVNGFPFLRFPKVQLGMHEKRISEKANLSPFHDESFVDWKCHRLTSHWCTSINLRIRSAQCKTSPKRNTNNTINYSQTHTKKEAKLRHSILA